jgi:hypothetical protein
MSSSGVANESRAERRPRGWRTYTPSAAKGEFEMAANFAILFKVLS